MQENQADRPLLLRDQAARKRLLWPLFFLNFEDLTNYPGRFFRIALAIHCGLLSIVCVSAFLLLGQFFLVALSRSSLANLDSLLSSFIANFHQTFIVLLTSLSLLFLPIAALGFICLTIFRSLGLFKSAPELNLPYFVHSDISTIALIYGLSLGLTVACFLYLEFDSRRRETRIIDLWYILQGSSIVQKKAKGTLLALEILEHKLWNLPQLREFFRRELEEAVHHNKVHLGYDAISTLDSGTLQQIQAQEILKKYVELKGLPKTRTRRKRGKSDTQGPLIAS